MLLMILSSNNGGRCRTQKKRQRGIIKGKQMHKGRDKDDSMQTGERERDKELGRS